jgi:integrative and conjugative element protein (TIGR02256 family)
MKFWSFEAGGQLFARIDGMKWSVERATGPSRTDFRTRFGFKPDRKREQEEIDNLFLSGLHYVGDWHTHPEAEPKPSIRDIVSLTEMVKKSRYDTPGFLLAIVGTALTPTGLWVSFHARDGSSRYLEPSKC